MPPVEERRARPRVLLLAPTVRDGEASRSVLASAGIECIVCQDLDGLCRAFAAGADVIMLPEETVQADTGGQLARLVARQPVWSDLPVVLLSRVGTESPAVATAMATLGNVSLVERPVRVSTLLSVVRSAVRARERQYQVREHLDRQRESEQSLREARAAAEAASRAKDEFMAALSHELRTPLTPVLATLSAWEAEDGLPSAMRHEVGMLRKNVELEARLIDDLLDLTRIAKGKLTLNPERVDVHELLRDVVEMFRGEIQAKRIVVTIAPGARTHHVRADSARLQQVFWNILRNALKFTPDGGRIDVATADAAGGCVTVAFTDTGIGMSEATLAKLFRPFEQGNDDMLRRYGGLGLGLAISKAMVDAHGGKLAATSGGLSRGATFAVTLATVAAPEFEAPVRKAPPGPASAARRLRILLVEDHEDTAKAMRRLLTARGHEVTECRSVASAVDAADGRAFDLLLSDIGLPDGTGIDVIRQVHARHRLPAIALTGFGMEEDVARCLAAGFDAHLTKPVNVQRLEVVIREVTAGAGVTSTKGGAAARMD
jgi:signal transduction histidine kinase/ActR/RegA family two-component response regulator